MAHGPHWAIAIHGGAGNISRSISTPHYHQALNESLQRGYDVLEAGYPPECWNHADVSPPPLALASALAAVETLETCPLFNAGRGGCLNSEGFVENEAAVMYGGDMKTGAVCGLTKIVHPSRLATLLYTHAEFQFLGFSAAEKYAEHFPLLIEQHDPSWFVTEHRKRSLAKAKVRAAQEIDDSAAASAASLPSIGASATPSDKVVNSEQEPHSQGNISISTENESATNNPSPSVSDQNNSASNLSAVNGEGETVGAVVCDGNGNVACVTSTGGVTNKWAGRIGDTPIIGAGSYASNKSCAVSGTGWGEQFIRLSAASRAVFAAEYGGYSVKDAIGHVVDTFPEETGGFVAVTTSGEIIVDFNSAGMFRGYKNWQGIDDVNIWK